MNTIDPALIPDPALRAEWEDFAGYGWPDDKIARRLGITLETLRVAVRRHTGQVAVA